MWRYIANFIKQQRSAIGQFETSSSLKESAGESALLMTSFYVVQRTCRARLFGGSLAWFVFWGYQLFIVMAATGYVLGITQAREYAEPEWYVDLWLTIVWVAYLAVYLGTILKRKEPHIYVANWFYLAFIVTIAMLHVVNNLAVPVSFLGSKSYSVFSGVQDALTQWWYGHNAVGFFLTAGFLGMMYYFVPKQANRPVYSYRLSIIHFWALIFMADNLNRRRHVLQHLDHPVGRLQERCATTGRADVDVPRHFTAASPSASFCFC